MAFALLSLSGVSGASSVTMAFPSATAVMKRRAPRQDAEDSRARVLERDKPVERGLIGGGSHRYNISLIKGQYLQVEADQRGVDLVLIVFGPDGSKLTEVDNFKQNEGTEATYLIAETTGLYIVEVRSLKRSASAGRYKIKITELRNATPKDRAALKAERAFQQACRGPENDGR